jgi:hypothetical protein
LAEKSGITQVVLAATPGESKLEQNGSPVFKIARVLMRLDHVASFIVNANHSAM